MVLISKEPAVIRKDLHCVILHLLSYLAGAGLLCIGDKDDVRPVLSEPLPLGKPSRILRMVVSREHTVKVEHLVSIHYPRPVSRKLLHPVHIPASPHHLHPLITGDYRIFLLQVIHPLVGHHACYEVIAPFLRAPEQIQMTYVEHIKGSGDIACMIFFIRYWYKFTPVYLMPVINAVVPHTMAVEPAGDLTVFTHADENLKGARLKLLYRVRRYYPNALNLLAPLAFIVIKNTVHGILFPVPVDKIPRILTGSE